MASKFFFFPMLFALALNVSNFLASELEAGRVPPVIHVISAVPGEKFPSIKLQITAGVVVGSAELSPGRDYQIKADIKDVNYGSAMYGLKFVLFNAYEPARDKDRAAVYWKADEWGFALSYNKINYRKVAPWESE